ncbi:hypothetical protein LQW54_000136 [Pestalotiopsis sp. IQ-011]
MSDDSSSTTWFSATDKTAEEEEGRPWEGQPPCVSRLSPLGCLEHNPQRWPVHRDDRLPPTEPRPNPLRRALKSLRSRAPDVSNVSADVPEVQQLTFPPNFCSRLPFDAKSYDTLTPLHPTMPYHLAFYHLDCVRRELFPDPDSREVAFVSQLSCSGTAQFYGGTSAIYRNSPEYTWSSEVYFDKGTFLQRQEISCLVGEPKQPPRFLRNFEFTACPHHKFRVNHVRVRVKRSGSFVAEGMVYLNKHSASAAHWHSKKDGPYVRAVLCTSCDTDHEQILAVTGGQLSIRVTTYKVLGTGRDQGGPEWSSALYGEPPYAGYRNLERVFGRILDTAKTLGRPEHIEHL